MKQESPLLTVVLGVVIGNVITGLLAMTIFPMVVEAAASDLFPAFLSMVFVVFFGWGILKMIRDSQQRKK